MNDFNGSNFNQVPQSVLKSYIELYKIVGMGEENFKLINSNHNYYEKEAIVDDVYYLFKCFFKNSKISEERLKTISEKNIETLKNKDEYMLRNIKRVFKTIYNESNFELISREVIDLKNMLYKDVLVNANAFIKTTDNIPTEKKLGSLCDKYYKMFNSLEFEPLYLASSFLIDFMYLRPFEEGNDIIGAILYYVLILKSDLKAFKYSSFFKELYNFKDEYDEAIKKGFYLHDEGLNNPSSLLKLLFKITINCYKNIDNLCGELSFDKKLSKSNVVINVIYKLNETFSKSEIVKALPGVSMSTIDRTLKYLSQVGKIQAYGVGRSAKWIRLDHSFDEVDFFKEN